MAATGIRSGTPNFINQFETFGGLSERTGVQKIEEHLRYPVAKSGPAGLTAATYLARFDLNDTVIDDG